MSERRILILRKSGTHRLLDILPRGASGEERAASERLRSRNDLAAVDHRILIVAKDSEGGEDELEVIHQLLLVICGHIVILIIEQTLQK